MTGTSNDQQSTLGSKRGLTRTGILAAVLIILLLTILLSRDSVIRRSGPVGENPLSITVGINNSLKSAPLVIADKKGFFSRERLDVKLVTEPSAAPLLERMVSGELEIVCAPEQLVAFLALERNDFRILAVLNRSQSQELIINSARGVYSPLGLKGRRIGLKMDSGAPYFLYRKLLYHDIALEDVILVDLEPEIMADKMVAGEIDAAIVWPPYSFRICQRLGKNALAFNAHVGRETYWLLVVRKDWCRDHMKAMDSFMAALQDAFDYMAASPEEAMATAADYFGFPVAEVRQEWAVYHFGLELPQSLLFAMEQEAKWQRQRIRVAGTPPDFLSLIAYRPLENLCPDKVTIIH